MKKALYFIALAALFSSCFTSRNTFNKGFGPEAVYTDSIAFTRASRVIMVPVVINGKTYRFLFDTGAPMVISTELAEELDAKRIKKDNVNDSQGKRNKLEYVRLNEMQISNQTFKNHTAIVANLKLAPALGCLQMDGIIGGNLMKHAIWRIDYENEVLHFTNDFANFLPDSNALVLPFRTKSTGTPVVDITIDTVTVKGVTFDTGSGGYFGVNKRLVPTFSPEKDSVRISYGYQSQGLFGATADSVYYTEKEMTIADSTIANFPMEIQFTKNSKLLGTRYFENFEVTLNWQTKRAYLSPRKPLIGRKSWGLSPFIEDGKLYIGTILYGSDAAKAGINQGDRIMAINGVNYENVTNTDYCEVLRVFKSNENKEIELKVEGKKAVKVKLETMF